MPPSAIARLGHYVGGVQKCWILDAGSWHSICAGVVRGTLTSFPFPLPMAIDFCGVFCGTGSSLTKSSIRWQINPNKWHVKNANLLMWLCSIWSSHCYCLTPTPLWRGFKRVCMIDRVVLSLECKRPLQPLLWKACHEYWGIPIIRFPTAFQIEWIH